MLEDLIAAAINDAVNKVAEFRIAHGQGHRRQQLPPGFKPLF